MYHTYILYSPSLDRFYVGHTEDLAERLVFHRKHTTRFTSRADDWRYVFHQAHASRSEAVNHPLAAIHSAPSPCES